MINSETNMHYLSIDLETFSSESIATSGLYRYAQSPDFDILLVGYSIDGAPSTSLDLFNSDDFGQFKTLILPMLDDATCIKKAWNAAFEWYCLSVWMQKTQWLSPSELLPINQWRDTMLQARYCGLPGGLDACGKALGMPEDKQKLATGKALIKTFCVPRSPTERDPRTRILPNDEPERWGLFKTYNAQDVVAEQAIGEKLSGWEVPAGVQKEWELSTLENARGVHVDIPLVRGAIRCGQHAAAPLLKEARELTGLENPNSVPQLLGWLKLNMTDPPANLQKETLANALGRTDVTPEVHRVLEIRQQLSKTSTKKYDAIANAVCRDSRVRGIMEFYGANRTGRFAGRIVQPQNFPRTHLDHLELARKLVEEGNTEAVRMLYGDVAHVLSMLIRTAFTPSPGNLFVDCDFSAIEARVIAWFAQEQWVLDVFNTTGKIYEATASQMFGVPMELITKGKPEYELRQRGKVAQLACIAEGSPVRVKYRDEFGDDWVTQVPIQDVTEKMRVWDGEGWVTCEGCVKMGKKPCFKYQGLTATLDHLVYPFGFSRPVSFMEAIENSLPLSKTSQDFTFSYAGELQTYDILNAGPNHRYTVSGVLVHNCGYGGGPSAMARMDNAHKIDPEEYPALVQKWRKANPHIVALWKETENAAFSALDGHPAWVKGKVLFQLEKPTQSPVSALTATLPNGRKLFYVNPGTGTNRFGSRSITYWGVNQTTKKWGVQETYGGKLVENLVQAMARDILCEKIAALESEGYPVAFSVHDEVILDVPKDRASLEAVKQIMAQPVSWAPGLPLSSDGWVGEYYTKD